MIPFQSQIATVTLIAGPMERLNAVTVSAAQLQGALERLALLRGDLRDKPVAQALALQAFAAEEASAENDAAAALHARIVALVRWTAADDPHPPVRCRIRDRGGVALSPQRER